MSSQTEPRSPLYRVEYETHYFEFDFGSRELCRSLSRNFEVWLNCRSNVSTRLSVDEISVFNKRNSLAVQDGRFRCWLQASWDSTFLNAFTPVMDQNRRPTGDNGQAGVRGGVG